MIELRIHHRRTIPEEHAIAIGGSTLSDVLRSHPSDPVKRIRGIGACSVRETHRSYGHGVDVILVAPRGEVAEAVLYQHLRVAGVRCARRGCLIQLALKIESGKTLRQQRRGHRRCNHPLR